MTQMIFLSDDLPIMQNKHMGCSRQVVKQIPLQRSDVFRGRFMAEISVYDLQMLVWLDESGYDKRNAI